MCLIIKTDSEVNNDVQGSNIIIDNCYHTTSNDCAYKEAHGNSVSEGDLHMVQNNEISGYENERENEVETELGFQGIF